MQDNPNLNNNKNNPNKNDNNSNNKRILLGVLAFALISTFLMNFILTSFSGANMLEIKYSDFMGLIDKGAVTEVEIESDRFIIYTDAEKVELPEGMSRTYRNTGNMVFYTGIVGDSELVQSLKDHNIKFTRKVTNSSPIIDFFKSWIMPIIILYISFSLIMRFATKRGGGIMGVGKSNAKVYMQKETGVTFKDVAGQSEAKESLQEIIDFLHNPDKYVKIGAKQPKGALLVGPPGTGKTLLAKAVAGEANVTFMSISGSDFVEMFVGVGASRVRDLFKQASENAPCIIFIDEIDAIGKKRDGSLNGNDEREQTLNQLLSEMDGFDSSKAIVILAATNRPDVLDKALLRPGRFDRRIIVEKPDLIGREDILKVHSKDVVLGDDVDLHAMALATSGAAGADLANMVNEAALRAVRMGRDKVLQEDLMEAVEVIIAGKEKKDRILSPKEKKIVSFHEVGHALASALQKHSQPVQKITIVPRTMGALGYTMQMPEEEKYLMSKDEMISEITTLLAGRAAEEVVFETVTTGASNDIERATKIARSMVSQYGMSDKFDMMALESTENKYLDGRNVAICGEQTTAELDSEVLRIIKECHESAKNILKENRDALDKIAEYLYEKETITGEQFMDILKEFVADIVDEKSDEEKTEEKEVVTLEKENVKENLEVDDKNSVDNSNEISENIENVEEK